MNDQDGGEPEPNDLLSADIPDELIETIEIKPADKEKPDWLTDMDIEILEVLGTELILSPSIIAENIDRSREGVSQRLNALQAGNLVEKVDRGKYKITWEGFDLVTTTYKTVVREEPEKENEVSDTE